MAKKKALDPEEHVVAPERVELLTTEFHPTDGRIQRWRMSDGTVITVKSDPVFVEKS